MNDQKCDISIHSDSLVSIKALNSVFQSQLSWKLPNELNRASKNYGLSLIWVPVHSIIKGNEETTILTMNSVTHWSRALLCIGKNTYKKWFLEKRKTERKWIDPKRSFRTLKLRSGQRSVHTSSWSTITTWHRATYRGSCNSALGLNNCQNRRLRNLIEYWKPCDTLTIFLWNKAL